MAGPGWTSTFSDALIKYAAKRRDIVAITAAMPGPTGLTAFGAKFPDRLFDVGIAEQHAMTSAAGLAMGGLHPVVAIYSTFLNRAFDQIMMDVALHKLPVTLVLDRSGVTGPDGASHNGMWDLSMLNIVPGMRVAAPRDAARLYEELGEALEVSDGPTALRFPKGDVGEDIPALERRDGIDVLAVPADGLSDDVLLVAVGPFAAMAKSVAERLRNQGIGVTVIDPRWVLPVPEAIGGAREDAQAGGHVGGQRCSRWRRLGRIGRAAPRRDRRAVPRRRAAAGVPGARLTRRGARRRRADRPGHRPPGDRVGGRAGQRGLRPRGQPPARLSETRPASSSVVDLRGCSKNTSALAAVDLHGGDRVPEQRTADVAPRHRWRGHSAPTHPPSDDGGRGPGPAEREHRLDEQRHVVVHRRAHQLMHGRPAR